MDDKNLTLVVALTDLQTDIISHIHSDTPPDLATLIRFHNVAALALDRARKVPDAALAKQ